MPLHFRCPCGVILNSPDGSAGRAAECPTCGKIIVIPQEAVSVALADLESPAPSGHPTDPTNRAVPWPAPEAAPPQPAPEPLVATDAEFRLPSVELPPFDASEPEPEPAPPAAESEAAPGPLAPGLVVDDDDVARGGSGAPVEIESVPTPPEWPAFEPEVMGEPTLMINVDQLKGGEPPEAEPGPGPQAEPQAELVAEEEPLAPLTEDPSAEPLMADLLEGGEEDLAPVVEPLEAVEALEPQGAAEPEGPPLPVLPASVEEAAAQMPDHLLPSFEDGAPAPAAAGEGTGKRASARAPRSQTTVARKRGRKALAALEAVEGGEVRTARRRSRRKPVRKGGRGKIVLVFLLVVVLLGAACFAALLFLPPHLVPEGLHDGVGSLRSSVRDLGLPVKLLGDPGGTGSEPEAPDEEAGE